MRFVYEQILNNMNSLKSMLHRRPFMTMKYMILRLYLLLDIQLNCLIVNLLTMDNNKLLFVNFLRQENKFGTDLIFRNPRLFSKNWQCCSITYLFISMPLYLFVPLTLDSFSMKTPKVIQFSMTRMCSSKASKKI